MNIFILVIYGAVSPLGEGSITLTRGKGLVNSIFRTPGNLQHNFGEKL